MRSELVCDRVSGGVAPVSSAQLRLKIRAGARAAREPDSGLNLKTPWFVSTSTACCAKAERCRDVDAYAQFRSNFSFKRHSSADKSSVAPEDLPHSHRLGPKDGLARTPSHDEVVSAGDSLTLSSSLGSRSGSAPSIELRNSESHAQNANAAEAGPLGLNVVHVPQGGRHKADIVFVHGLGGTSRNTWSKHRREELFWPLHFLSQEPDVGQARILTFGYNSNFSRRGSISVSILDFAKDLLFDLKYAKDENTEDLCIGSVGNTFDPLIWAESGKCCF
jgi:hypothetical protein